jgi:ABC-type nitrate/sulfonate/bicarbonate transport system permease component
VKRDALTRVIPVVLVAALWEIAPMAGWVRPEFLPSLSDVALAFMRQLASGELPYHAVASLSNCAAGLAGGIVIGVALGVLMAWHPLLNAVAGPLVQMTYPIPRSALVPVMIVWFGLGPASKIAAIFSGCLLPVIISAYNGARGVDRTLIWSALGLGASRAQVLWEIVVPSAFPDIMAGIRSAIAIAFVLMVTSEFLVGGRGLGYLISFLGDAGAYAAMFAVVLTVAALGFIADRLYLALMTRVLRWRE